MEKHRYHLRYLYEHGRVIGGRQRLIRILAEASESRDIKQIDAAALVFKLEDGGCKLAFDKNPERYVGNGK